MITVPYKISVSDLNVVGPPWIAKVISWPSDGRPDFVFGKTRSVQTNKQEVECFLSIEASPGNILRIGHPLRDKVERSVKAPAVWLKVGEDLSLEILSFTQAKLSFLSTVTFFSASEVFSEKIGTSEEPKPLDFSDMKFVVRAEGVETFNLKLYETITLPKLGKKKLEEWVRGEVAFLLRDLEDSELDLVIRLVQEEKAKRKGVEEEENFDFFPPDRVFDFGVE